VIFLKEKIDRWVSGNEEKVVSFLQDLLRIPSVTGNEKPIQEFIADYVGRLGLEVDMFVPSLDELRRHEGFVPVDSSYDDRPNVVATWKGAGGGRSLLFNGHVDVIPEGAPENWQFGFWSGDIHEGKMYGRGASDMKSGVAAMTMAVEAVKAMGLRLKGDIILEYVMDEELSGNGTRACVMRGYKADAGICCETSSMCVQPGSIGRIWFEVHIKGKEAGIQRRFEGVNAIELGCIVNRIVSDFEKIRLETVSHELYPTIETAIPCMIGEFHSGTYNSAFPDSALLKGSMATVPGENSAEVMNALVKYITEESAKQSEWLKDNPPEVIFKGYFAEPSSIPVDSPIVKTLSESFRTVMGEDPVISGREGAADIRFLNQYGETPTVIFGPGRTEQMHANNEWVSIEDYLNSIRILIGTIIEWCGVAEA
jgi:acetylornithine deacetylase